MKHPVNEYPVPLVLKDILMGNLSGELTINGPNFSKTLFFMDGVLVSARSTQLDERIGVVLHMIGKINQDLFDNISGLVQSVNPEIGDILVQNGFVSKHDLYAARRYLVRRIAFSTFTLDKGEWTFSKKMPAIPESEKFFMQLPGILITGSRKITDFSYFKNKIYFKSPTTTDLPGNILPLLTPEELTFYRNLTKSKDLSNREIISQLNIIPDIYWQRIALFIMLDLVDFHDLPENNQITENITALLKLNNSIGEPGVNPYTLLNLEKPAAMEDIEDAYREHTHRFKPERFGSAAAPEIKRIARFVLDQLKIAYTTLIGEARQSIKSPLEILPTLANKPLHKSNIIYKRAKDLYNQNKFEEAVRLLKEAGKLQPNEASYLCLLGICQSEIDYFQGDAERNLKKAIELDSQSSEPVYALGQLFRKQNKLKLSEKCFQHVLEIDHSHFQASKAIASLYNPQKAPKASLFSILHNKK